MATYIPTAICKLVELVAHGEPVSADYFDQRGLTTLLNRAMVAGVVDCRDGVVFITDSGRTALRRRGARMNLIATAKRAADFLDTVPDGRELSEQLRIAISDAERVSTAVEAPNPQKPRRSVRKRRPRIPAII